MNKKSLPVIETADDLLKFALDLWPAFDPYLVPGAVKAVGEDSATTTRSLLEDKHHGPS